VVDDNEYNTMALKFLLESIGLFADTAISGHEAIDIVTQRENENKPFQCIFMDLEMTGLNGFQTTKRIHQLNPRLPVFACSGWNDQQTIEDCKQAGMLDIIPKPVQKQHVRRLLKAHFENLRADPSQKCITMKD
jgi:CheY-like chemotaxis protein